MLRGLRTLFLIWTFLLGQSHLCASEYVLPSGQSCRVCLTLVDAPKLKASLSQNELQARHGDCHDCCSIKACDKDTQPLKADFKPAPVFAAILPPTFVFVSVIAPVFRAELPPAVELYLPHGPPTDRPSRAPPVSFV